MKVEIRIVPQREEPAIIVEAAALTPEVEALAARLRERENGPLVGYRGETAALLERGEILRFYAADKAVFAQTGRGEFRMKERLYELEELLDPRQFVRVSNAEIVNLRQVTALDLSLGGTIKMTLADGKAICWVSRRNVKNIKKALGL